MIKAQRVNNTIVCVIGNKMYQKTFDSETDILSVYELIMNTDETNLEDTCKLTEIFAPKATHDELQLKLKLEEAEEELVKQNELINWFKEIEETNNSLFRVSGFKFYLKGINITVPESLIKEFYNRRNNVEDTKAMINFWRLLSLNEDPRCRENLFTFLSNHKITLTPSGYFVAYRNVNIYQEGDKKLNDYVIKMWIKLKNWKKSPKNYAIVQNSEGEYETLLDHQVSASSLSVIGNLEDLYNSPLGEETIYTDNHTGKFRIKIGEMVSMPKSECDASQDSECSKGLHVASSSWLSENYFGHQGIVCLVNPMHVVSVPYADAGKLRCHQYLPIGLAEYDKDGKIIPMESKTFEHQYSECTEEELMIMLKTHNLEQLKEHQLIPKELDIQSLKEALNGITITKEEMNSIISNKKIKV